ncbi:MAG: DNRLRE domain-containing protein, partial [Clostridia bacterium]|nr:DNRLRE domain-containing protein [Clostridia bacterium]
MKIRFIKLIAIILTMLTFSTVCEQSLAVFADEIRNGENGAEWASDYTEGADLEVYDSAGNEFEAVPYIIGEDESLRTENSKTFRQSDGSFICSVYQEPVHFKNAEGEWEDIDNTLVANESGYKNKSSDFEVVFNSDPEKNDLFTLTYDGSVVSVSFLSEETTDPDLSEATETVFDETETEHGETESETDVELLETENETDVGYSEPETDIAPEKNDAPEEMTSASETETVTDPVEPIGAREITVLPKSAEQTVSPSLLKTAGEIESDLLARDPDVSDEYIKAAVGRQNEINEKQRAERMTPDYLNSSIVYGGLIPGADIRYDLAPQKVKESIIINEPCESCDYSFFVGTSLCAEKTDGGEIVLSKKDGEPIFLMPSPYMYDADGNESCDAEYSVSETEGGYILSVVASTEWINDAERSFPVVIDPTIASAKMSGADWNIITQYVHSLDLNTLHSGEEYWKTGAVRVSNSIAQYYSYMKIQYIPTVPFSCKFISSHLYLPHISYTNGGVSSYNLTVREALANWRSEWTSGATNNNPVIDYITLSNSVAGSYVSMDVTNAVRNWKNGSTNNGLVFTSQKTNGSQMTYSSYANSIFCGYVNNAS